MWQCSSSKRCGQDSEKHVVSLSLASFCVTMRGVVATGAKGGGSVLVPVTGLLAKEKSSQVTPQGAGLYIWRPRLLQMGASAAQEILFIKMCFQLIAKEEMVTDAGRRQILPTPHKSCLTERSDASVCDALLSRQQASVLSCKKRTCLDQYRVGQPMLLMVLENILE